MIQTPEALGALLPRLRDSPWLALDTEADSLHAYPEKLCLLQVSLPGADELIDPLARLDLAPLWETFAGRDLILHGADYDLRLLNEHHAFRPHAVFDTMIAARLLGCAKFGLSDLVGQFLGITLEKGPQKANWAMRPLSPRMAAYAQNDTRHLKPLVDILETQLREKGRLDWCRETCARLIVECARPSVPDPDREWRIKGSFRLGRPALAVLRDLWRWREAEARLANKPPFFIMNHDMLVALAAAAVNGTDTRTLLPRHLSPRRAEGVAAAIQSGLAVPVAAQPEFLRNEAYHPSRAEQQRFDELKRKRDECANTLGIDPTLIASRLTLELLSRRDSTASADQMKWQRELLSV